MLTQEPPRNNQSEQENINMRFHHYSLIVRIGVQRSTLIAEPLVEMAPFAVASL